MGTCTLVCLVLLFLGGGSVGADRVLIRYLYLLDEIRHNSGHL